MLPRLFYVGDVPVEASYHGSALIYRLLKNYPPTGVMITEAGSEISIPNRRLPGVRYEDMKIAASRWLSTRLNAWVVSWLSMSAGMRYRRVQSLTKSFKPQAVLTVTHGFGWLTAARLAESLGLPLVLICHDDWPSVANVVGPLEPWLDRQFGEIYRQADVRFCVSPIMAEEYRRRYGVGGTVLYPSRDENNPTFQSSPAPRAETRPFTVAYAGTLTTTDYVRQLGSLAQILQRGNGRLLLFGPFGADALATSGLIEKNVEFGGLLKSAALIHRLRDEADVLFLPMSFVSGELGASSLNFPSKLTDYTAAALPILIWGPTQSAAVQWAMNEPTGAAVVTDPTEHAMAAMIDKLRSDPDWRNRLAVGASDAGNRYFSAAVAQRIFYGGLHQLVGRAAANA
jgi:glycosyltransferase involved in cell wall biosynthesis